ncbi:hypothetical protein Q5P01_012052 [Channa striata]|uniref:DEP domain-containing protein 7 n=1 Tax=Channa striata TaxID=64152 RepID=A0AA88SL79_CHASR|nr:hypothetical protein Q5P01_012052 [Channa striata]
MASIKERAAALKLAEKLCVRPQAYGVTSKSVQSSSLWSGLISHLRSCVPVKRRRVHLKTHSGCFLGSEAVDVLTEHINHAKGLEGGVVARDKVVCVCQALLDCNVFESVGTKVFGKEKNVRDVFQDSKSALYRFVNVHMPSVEELEKVVLANGIQNLFCSPPSDSQEEQTRPTGPRVHMSTPARLPQTATVANQLDAHVTPSLSVEPEVDRLSVSPSKLQTDTVLPQSLVEEMWQEQTLLRLNPQLPYSSNLLDRQILKAFRDTREDECLRAALDCLDFLPDQPVVQLSRELPHCFPQADNSCDQVPDVNPHAQPLHSGNGLDQCKLLLYATLVQHYSNTDRPALLPEHMNDIYTAIIDLLVNAKLNTALEALQLCLKLLPHSTREELRRLLTFMSLAADPQSVQLNKEMENRLAIKKSFCRAVIHSKALSKDKEDLMVVFMLSNVEEIFKIPGALHKEVSDKLASIVQGKKQHVAGSTFCQQVPSRTYTDSTKKTTNQELWTLLSGIHLDTKISEKERKRLLRQFYQAHPQIFNQYFGDSAAASGSGGVENKPETVSNVSARQRGDAAAAGVLVVFTSVVFSL